MLLRVCEKRRFPARNPDTSMEVSDLYLYIKKEMLLH